MVTKVLFYENGFPYKFANLFMVKNAVIKSTIIGIAKN